MEKIKELRMTLVILLVGVFFLSGCFFNDDKTVTFKTNGGSEIKNMVVKSGSKVKEAPIPVKEGYIFEGWYLDGEEYNFDDGVEEIKIILDKAEFDFEYECNCSEDAAVSLDVDKFVRVISNIISNSIKYSNPDVRGKIRFSINEYERSVIIELVDNGIGVDRESVSKIFDLMYRADSARTNVADGSGLGLSVCKQIVELHRGIIWASSNLGEGLSIFISLPKVRRIENNEQNTDN